MADDLDMPPLLTEEEAAQKASMMKATENVAEAADELRQNFERRGWNNPEVAALTLFNTLLMTAFGEGMRNAQEEAQKKREKAKDRFTEIAVGIASARGFTQDVRGAEIVDTCLKMFVDDRPQEQYTAVWEDFFGDGTGGVLIGIITRAQAELKAELEADT